MICRYCGNKTEHVFVDLGMAPLSNDFLNKEEVSKGQYTLPLKVYVCESCKLVQVENYEMPNKIFNEDYKYFSSYSSSWLSHCEKYVNMIYERRSLNEHSNVVEIASNDGYLLQYFKNKGINPIGIEPSEKCADIAIGIGIETRKTFFTAKYAEMMSEKGEKADLIIGNNVLAHVPNIGDFVKGLSILLKENGIITLEFPHLYNLIKCGQFDTIYHEHFSYLSLLAVKYIFESEGLSIVDVDELATHGGSLRIYAMHEKNAEKENLNKVKNLLQKELEFGMDSIELYVNFAEYVKKKKCLILEYLIDLKKKGKTIVGYGAAAKGNTLLNYCGIGNEIIDYVVDASPHKQNMVLPGSLLEVKHPREIERTKPDYLLILPWNIHQEIIDDWSLIKDWGGKFITLIPQILEE